MVNDRVGDFIVRLANAAAIGTREVSVPRSNHVVAIAKKLNELGFLERVEDDERTCRVALAYGEDGRSRLRGVKRLSKPSRRLYVPATAAHAVKGGTGARVISSSKGIVSDAEARKNHLGGETLFEIW